MTASRGSMKKGILALWRFKRGDYFKDYKGQVYTCIGICLCVLYSVGIGLFCSSTVRVHALYSVQD